MHPAQARRGWRTPKTCVPSGFEDRANERRRHRHNDRSPARRRGFCPGCLCRFPEAREAKWFYNAWMISVPVSDDSDWHSLQCDTARIINEVFDSCRRYYILIFDPDASAQIVAVNSGFDCKDIAEFKNVIPL